MKFSQAALHTLTILSASTVLLEAFAPNVGSSRRSLENARKNIQSSGLQMAFDMPEGVTSNMFDGPAPLVKERDACGVGFVANTSSGGTWFDYSCYFCKLRSAIFEGSNDACFLYINSNFRLSYL